MMGMKETIIAGVIVGLLVIIIVAFWKKIWPRIKNLFKKEKPPDIDPQKKADLRLLGKIQKPLLFINQLPSYRQTKKKEIRDQLFEIQLKAREIRTPDFDDIKTKLIQYGEKVDQVHDTIRLDELLKLLVRPSQAIDLVQEIREIISSEVK
jgi:hypothetical protein